MNATNLIFALMVLFIGCNKTDSSETATDPRAESLEQIDAYKLRLKAMKEQKGTFPADSVLALVDMYEKFADDFPEDSLSADFLFKGADLAQGNGEPGRGIKLFGQVWRRFPDHKMAADAVFMQGFLFENAIGDMNNAKKYYNRLMNQYPKSPLVEQAKMALQNLGKSPAELLQEIKQR